MTGRDGVDTGVVVIGRNESERLRRCLRSVIGRGAPVVYVDSGSTDGSPRLAAAAGATVVELDRSAPFSAARARNAGLDRLTADHPDVAFVQFVDGDCEIAPEWIARGRRELIDRPDVAIVCGRLRERAPRESIYQRLCDLEWRAPVGEVKACGGIAMMRAGTLRESGGFDPTLSAGEEPELCLRLRRAGWKIVRVEEDMAQHDAAMRRFGQWWTRSVRGGHAFAAGAARHGRSRERHGVRACRSIAWWGALYPLLAAGLAAPTRGAALLLLAAYPALAARVAWRRRRGGDPAGDAWLYGAFCVLAKFPQALGLARFAWTRWRNAPEAAFDYKTAAAPKFEARSAKP